MKWPGGFMPCLSSKADSDLKESIRVSNAESQLALPFMMTTVFGASVICSPNGSAAWTGAAAGGGVAGVSAAAGGVVGAAEGPAAGAGLAVGGGAGGAGGAGGRARGRGCPRPRAELWERPRGRLPEPGLLSAAGRELRVGRAPASPAY